MYDDLLPPTVEELTMRKARWTDSEKSSHVRCDAHDGKEDSNVAAAEKVPQQASKPRNVHKLKGVTGFSVLSRRPSYRAMIARVLIENAQKSGGDRYTSRHALQRQVYERFFDNSNAHVKNIAGDAGRKVVKMHLVHKRVCEALEELVSREEVEQNKLSYRLR